ncbi:MAG TPA: nucleotidyltransferase family protein [Gemmatimonadaceae bacterium]|nr:nucleotidyltransferase family protein [Gemmatimonadaceae bacterium]
MIAGLLLASGASRRFGSNKLLADLDGRPVVRWSADALAGTVDLVIVVVPEGSHALRAALDGLDARLVENAAASEGVASSIRAGIAVLPPEVEAVVIVLGDQPTLPPAVIRRVVEQWLGAPHGTLAVTTKYSDGRGHPTLIGAELFRALLSLTGDRGARDLLDSLGDAVAVVEVAGPRPADVDTPAALASLERDVARGP